MATGLASGPLSGVFQSITEVVHGKDDVVEAVLTAVLAGGHLLLEDVPGVGKTTLARATAQALGCSHKRLQFTSDLLPSDVVGAMVFDTRDASFSFRPGPVFTQVLLADEINRTTPKTQSALLEAMSEGVVTVDGVAHDLPVPFVVLATQNPVEHHGTYPLPQSQLDRFMLCVSMGYPGRAAERAVLRARPARPAPARRVLQEGELLGLQARVEGVHIASEVEDFILELVAATRSSSDILVGASPRATQSLAQACRARALAHGREFVSPDDVKALAVPVLAHRLRVVDGRGAGRQAGVRVLERILEGLVVPR